MINEIEMENVTREDKSQIENVKLPVFMGNIYDKDKTISQTLTIEEIYRDIITSDEFIVSNGKTLKKLSNKIFEIQQELNAITDKETEEWQQLYSMKSTLKKQLGGVYYQTINKTMQKAEETNRLSGKIVLDIDNYAADYSEAMAKLKKLSYVEMFFKSPSGGLKIILKIDSVGLDVDRALYRSMYELIVSRLRDDGVDIDYDPSAKTNTNLFCFFAFDTNAYFNGNANELKVLEQAKGILLEAENIKKTVKTVEYVSGSIDIVHVENLVHQLNTSSWHYDDYLHNVCFPLINEYDDSGRDLAVSFCNSRYGKYSWGEKLRSRCCQEGRGIGSLLYVCKQQGIVIKKHRQISTLEEKLAEIGYKHKDAPTIINNIKKISGKEAIDASGYVLEKRLMDMSKELKNDIYYLKWCLSQMSCEDAGFKRINHQVKALEHEQKKESLAEDKIDDLILRYKKICFISTHNQYLFRNGLGCWDFIKLSGLQGDCSLLKKDSYESMLNNKIDNYQTITYTCKIVDGTVKNLLDMSEWTQPDSDAIEYDRRFDGLFESIGGGCPEQKAHIEQVLIYKYLHPETYTLPSLNFIDEKGGSGKNVLVEYLLKTIFTEDCVSVIKMKHLIGDFNSMLRGKVIIMIDEMIKNVKEGETVKAIIGQKTLQINEKFVKEYQCDNTALYMSTCNNIMGSVVVNGSGQSGTDRRYSIIGKDNSKTLSNFVGDVSELVVLLSDKKEVAKWLGIKIKEFNDLPMPKALHGKAYDELKKVQSDAYSELIEELFNNQDSSIRFLTVKSTYSKYRELCNDGGFFCDNKAIFTQKMSKRPPKDWIFVERYASVDCDGNRSQTNSFVREMMIAI